METRTAAVRNSGQQYYYIGYKSMRLSILCVRMTVCKCVCVCVCNHPHSKYTRLWKSAKGCIRLLLYCYNIYKG